MQELNKPICFLDLETTGTNVKEDAIVEIAIVKIFPDGERETFESYVNPLRPIPQAASEVHRITDETVKDAPTFKELSTTVLNLISSSDIGGFNSNRFDIPLLYNEFKRVGYTWAWQMSNFIDIGNIYKIKEPRTLSAAYQFYVGAELQEAHRAINDVEATIEVFQRQLEKYQDLQGKEVAEIAHISNFEKKIVDITGTFCMNDANEIVFNFGKHKGVVAAKEKSYLQWMLKPTSGFDDEVKKIAQSLLYS